MVWINKLDGGWEEKESTHNLDHANLNFFNAVYIMQYIYIYIYMRI